MSILHRAGLKSAMLNDKYAYVPLSGLAKALKLASHETDDSCAGLHFGEDYSPPVRHACYFAITHAPDLRGALTSLASHRNSVVNIPTQFVNREGMAAFNWTIHEEIDEPEHIVALTAMRTLRHIQEAAGPEWHPLSVHLTIGVPENVSEYYRLLGPNIRFDQHENSFLIGRETLDLPMPHADPDLYVVARNSFLMPILGKLDDDNPVDCIRRFVAERLQNNSATVDAVSKHMGMSQPQLRRLLKKHDTCFQCILDETRMTVVEHYLTHTDKRFSEIAYLIGFSDQSAFTRAVKRWFDATPKQLRRSNS